ncbi:hypothetical protein BD410DRAFT_897005 [Rickenella mellea]|uniref:Uncharacterized protein n=1 Tax=Rickenella mellea TaxID=50990 RepID=A0A4Y7QA57_9AGAM|nr:hypothetical protein BD410DRAFT_897005 [Rickenella mellea]
MSAGPSRFALPAVRERPTTPAAVSATDEGQPTANTNGKQRPTKQQRTASDEPPGARRTPTATATAKGPTVTATTSNVRRKTHKHYEREQRTTDPKPQPQATTDDNEPLGAPIGGLRRRDVDRGVHRVPPASRSPTVVARRRGVRTPRGRHDEHNDGAIAKIAPGARRIETAPTNPRTDPHHTTSRTPPPLHRHHSPQPTLLTRGLTHAPHGEATAAHARPTTEQRETPNKATGDTTNNTTSGRWRRTDSKRREGATSDEDDERASKQRRAHRNRRPENDKDGAIGEIAPSIFIIITARPQLPNCSITSTPATTSTPPLARKHTHTQHPPHSSLTREHASAHPLPPPAVRSESAQPRDQHTTWRARRPGTPITSTRSTAGSQVEN